MNKRIVIFRTVLCLAMALSILTVKSINGQEQTWGASSGHAGHAAVFAIVTEEGRIIIYRTENPGLAQKVREGAKYRVFYKSKEAGTIKISQIEKKYIVALVVAGKLNWNLEGKTLELVDYSHEYRVTPEEVKGDLETLEERNVIPRAPESGKMILIDTDSKKEAKSGGRSGRAGNRQTTESAGEESGTTGRSPRGRKQEKSASKREAGPARKSRSGKAARSEDSSADDARADVDVSVQTRDPAAGSAGESIDVETKKKKKKLIKPINNFQLRYESHDDDSGSGLENVFTAVISSTRTVNDTLITLFGVHSRSEYGGLDDNSDDHSTTAGISYTRFYRQTEYGSASYSLTFDDEADDETRGMFFFSYNWILDMQGNRQESSYYRLSASYATDEDFQQGRSGTIGLDFYKKSNPETKWNAGYDYIYSFDTDEHIFNQYTLDYTFLLRPKEKLTIGYRLIDREYGDEEYGSDTDDVFRAIYSVSY